MDLNTSSFLFDQLGGVTSLDDASGTQTNNVKFIDSNVRLTGVKTGVLIDIPIRYVRLA